MTDPTPAIAWLDAQGQAHEAPWRSEAGWPAPARVQTADDTLNADRAYKLVCEGTALLWQGDYHQARQMLQALTRRLDRKPFQPRPGSTPAEVFHQHRQRQGHRARLLAMVLVEVRVQEGRLTVPLRRAPEVNDACREAWGPQADGCVLSLRELLGLIGGHEWRRQGVFIEALGERIHPHYGVFSPVRGEYLDLVARAPLPAGAKALAFDIGTGTGVVAALLNRRGVKQVVATDLDARALACAAENLQRLGSSSGVELLEADLFPPGRAPLVACNPPWLPGRPTSAVEGAVYDPDSRMLRGFLGGLAAHLTPDGEGWLILSDLAEHLGLRTREQLLGWIAEAGLTVKGRLDTRPRHGKAQDTSDPLHAARSAEVTSLWRLGALQVTNS